MRETEKIEDYELDDWFDYITKELDGEEVLPSVNVARVPYRNIILHVKVQGLYAPSRQAQYLRAVSWATEADGTTPVAVKKLSVELRINGKSILRKSIELGGMVATGILRKSTNRPIPAQAGARSENPKIEVTTESVP